MKIRVQCPECVALNIEDSSRDLELSLNEQEYTDKVFEFTCPNGHHVKKFMATAKYEILYDMGIMALKDGYYREAVLDFAAALERFYESCVFSFWYKLRFDTITKMNEQWKEMSKQSERQLGAFCALYFAVIGNRAPLMNDKNIRFRNDVTHKGYFPTEKEATGYGKKIAEYIRGRIKELQESSVPIEFGGIYPGIKEVLSTEGEKEMGGHNINTVLFYMTQMDEDWENAIKSFFEQSNWYYRK